jgi:hypothetical protein
MKRILFFLLLLSSIAKAQTDDSTKYTNYRYLYGNRTARIWADSILRTPADTATDAAIGSIAHIGDSIYTKTTIGWTLLNLDSRTGLISGGIVSWTGYGLSFDVTGAVYVINGKRFVSPADSVTLDAADDLLPRIDIIVVDNTGAIVVVKGDPATNPSIPQFDPNTQVYLTSILINAGETTPSGVARTMVYDENEEWTASSSGLTASFDNTSNVYHGTKSGVLTSVTNGSTVTFTNTAPLTVASFTVLKLFIRLNTTTFLIFNPPRVRVTFFNGATQSSNTVDISAYGFDPHTQASYQNISIPFSAFNFTSTSFDAIRLSFNGSNSGYYLDYAQIQQGITTNSANGINSLNGQTNAAQQFVGENIQINSDNGIHTFTIDTTNLLSTKANVNRVVDSAMATVSGGITQSQLDDSTTNVRNDLLDAIRDSVSNRLTGVIRRSDSVFTVINGVETFAYKDSTGSIYTDEQAQDAIGAMVSSEFTYTDATPLLSINAIAQSKITGLISDLAAKQDVLVSGTNIKTVNGTSLLGSGNISITSGWGLSGNSISYGNYFGTTNNQSLPFRTNDTTRMILDSLGALLIGATSNNFLRPMVYIDGNAASRIPLMVKVKDQMTNGFTVNTIAGSGSIRMGWSGTFPFNNEINFTNGQSAANIISSDQNLQIKVNSNTNIIFNTTGGFQSNGISQFENYLKIKEISAPSTPASGYQGLYGKSDGYLYYKNSAATETRISKPTLSKSATIEFPATTDSADLFYTPVAITVAKVADGLRGTSPSVTYDVLYATDMSSSSPSELFGTDRTVTSTTGTTTTTFSDATIPAGSWVWLKASAGSGTVRNIAFTIIYTED